MTQWVTDVVGTQHERVGPEARIISLVPSLTELVVDLGLGEQLVGRTGFCIHPRSHVRHVAKVGGTKNIKVEQIRALAATHVLVNVDENRLEDAKTLSSLGLKVVATHPKTVDDNLALYGLLGALFGVHDKARGLCSELSAKLAAVRANRIAPLRRVLYLIWRDPWMTISADTYIANMLSLAGAKPVEMDDDARYPVISDTHPAWADCDAILLSSEPFPFRQKHVEEIRKLAQRTDKPVLLVDGELLSWYGSRALAGVDYAAQLANDLTSDCGDPES